MQFRVTVTVIAKCAWAKEGSTKEYDQIASYKWQRLWGNLFNWNCRGPLAIHSSIFHEDNFLHLGCDAVNVRVSQNCIKLDEFMVFCLEV